VNTVTLVGNIATDVELREVADGKKVASFLLAVDRPSKSDEADFIQISAWDRQAELCDEYLGKGRLVGVEGRLRSRSWTDPDGKRHTAVDVTAGRVEFISGSRRAEAEEAPLEEAAVA
jgi:single-strand DNA-binding protein